MRAVNKWKTVLGISIITLIISIVALFLWISHSDRIGGDAMNGYSENNKFYIYAKGDGVKYILVDKDVWYLNRILFIVFIVLFIPSSLIVFYMFYRYYYLPRIKKVGNFIKNRFKN